MNSAIEWIKENDEMIANHLIGYYYNSPPNSLSSYQYGFCQLNRRRINENNCNQPESSLLRTVLSVLMAYSPYYSCSFEEGKFMYPIILNNFQLGSFYYYYPLDLYTYYLELSLNRPPTYFIKVLYNYIWNNHAYLFQLTYTHEMVQCSSPIHYVWKLMTIVYVVQSSSVMQSYCQLRDEIENIFTSMDNKKVQDLLPEPLLFYFCDNYMYNLGFNIGLNGSFPSNNVCHSNELYPKKSEE